LAEADLSEDEPVVAAVGVLLGAGSMANKAPTPLPAILAASANFAFFRKTDSSSSESDSGSSVGKLWYLLVFGCVGADAEAETEAEADEDLVVVVAAGLVVDLGGGSRLERELIFALAAPVFTAVDEDARVAAGAGIDSEPESSESDPYAASASIVEEERKECVSKVAAQTRIKSNSSHVTWALLPFNTAPISLSHSPTSPTPLPSRSPCRRPTLSSCQRFSRKFQPMSQRRVFSPVHSYPRPGTRSSYPISGTRS